MHELCGWTYYSTLVPGPRAVLCCNSGEGRAPMVQGMIGAFALNVLPFLLQAYANLSMWHYYQQVLLCHSTTIPELLLSALCYGTGTCLL